jgi:hypothetical protein
VSEAHKGFDPKQNQRPGAETRKRRCFVGFFDSVVGIYRRELKRTGHRWNHSVDAGLALFLNHNTQNDVYTMSNICHFQNDLQTRFMSESRARRAEHFSI